MAPDGDHAKGGRRRWIWLLFPLIALLFLNTRLAGLLGEWVRSVEAPGPWVPFIFAGAITAAVVLVIPTGPLTLGAGFMLGLVRGCAAVLAGMTLGSALAFLAARHLVRASVERAAARRPELAALDEAVTTEGWKLVFLIRLVPFFPSKLANYVFGVTRLRFWPYTLASLLGFVPNTISAVYIGSLAREAAAPEGGVGPTPLEWVVRGIGLVAIIVFSVTIARIARRVHRARFGRG